MSQTDSPITVASRRRSQPSKVAGFLDRFIPKNPTASFGIAMGASTLVAISLLVFGIFLSCPDWALTLIMCLTGYVMGIPLGIVASPHGAGEATNFRTFAAYVATFFSGYVFSKLSSLNVGQMLMATLVNPLYIGRVLLFAAFFILGIVQTFVLRSYVDETRELGTYAGNATPDKNNNPPANTNAGKKEHVGEQ